MNVSQNDKDRGNRLAMLRRELKLSQAQVAKAIGISTSNYTKMETGERDLKSEHCIKLAEFFHKDCDYLLRGVETKHLDIYTQLGLSNETISTIQNERGEGDNSLSELINDLVSTKNGRTVLLVMDEIRKFDSHSFPTVNYIDNTSYQLGPEAVLHALSYNLEEAFSRFVLESTAEGSDNNGKHQEANQ